MSRYEDLVAEQNRIWAHMQETKSVVDKDGWTGETRESWDKDEKRLSEVSEDIEREERATRYAEVDRRQHVETGKPGEDEGEGRDDEAERAGEYRAAFEQYVRKGMNECSPDQRRMLSESRALAHSPDSAGGFLVPDEYSNKILETKKAFGGIETFAETITTATGARMPWLINDDTANEGAILGENAQIGEQDMTFDEDEIGAYTYTSKMIRVPWALLQDSAIDLQSFLGRKLGERLGRISARHWISGTGTGQPTGLVTAATVGVTGTGTSAISYDNLIDLEHSLNGAYRNNGRYILSDGALKVIRKLKDADGRPIWVPIPAPGFPATINGNPYSVEWTMDDPGANKVTILFGDIRSAYLIRQVKGLTMVVMNERYADYLQTGMFAYLRQDGVLQDANAVRAFKHAAS